MASSASNNIMKKIKILLISDIHLNISNIAKVDEYIKASNIKIHHLWAPGDFLNIKEEDQDDEKKLQQYENELNDLLKEIKKIHPNPVIIPGNHDPKTLFATDNDKYFNFGECINIHNRIYGVNGETNLYMVGFGGSVPAFCFNKLYWTGYPYTDDEMFAKQYNALMQRIIDTIKTDKCIVLFTHNGPSMCSTTMDWRFNEKDKVITTGSNSVMQSLFNQKLRNKIFVNIHGHTHLGFGQGHIGDIRIINPGSLKGGDINNNFAILDLVQHKDETWHVGTVQFINLSDL